MSIVSTLTVHIHITLLIIICKDDFWKNILSRICFPWE